MSKLDRVYPRKASDLEMKYNFGKSFAEAVGIAEDAKTVAEEAKKTAESVDENLTSEEIFNRLTNNGANQGLYRGDDDDLYVNANYIKSGEIDANIVKVKNLTVDAAQIKTGTIDVARIPDLSADKITSGTINAEIVTIKNLTVDAAQIKTGVFDVARIPELSADKITSGTLDAARIDGGTLNITKGATIAGWDIDGNSIYKGTNWGTSTFMCTGSSSKYSIGGSASMSGWVFGAGGKFGVTKGGDVYCSALNATSGCKLGGWYISGDSITTAANGDAENTVWLDPDRVHYIYNQGAGYAIYASWEDIIKAVNSYADLEGRVAALEA